MPDQTTYTSKLRGARILIIGGTSGIGHGLAAATLEYGAHVTIASSNPNSISSALASLQSAYPSAVSRLRGLRVDLSNPSTLEPELSRLFQETVSIFPANDQKIDHVVFTAGDALTTTPISELSVPNILHAGQIRFLAPLLTSKFLPQYLRQSHKSSFTLTTGSVAEKPLPNWTIVASYCGAIHSMVRNLALDLRPIRVNAVSASALDTPLWRVEGEERERFFGDVKGGLATGRVGSVEDVVEAFLCCLRDGNMDGGVLRSDGGSLVL